MAKKQDNFVMVTRGWSSKLMGPKLTREQVAMAHAISGANRKFGKEALARALELRDGGATDGQVKSAVINVWGSSGSHHNKRKALAKAKLIAVDKGSADAGGHTVYKISLTDKGKEVVKASGLMPKVKAVVPEVSQEQQWHADSLAE